MNDIETKTNVIFEQEAREKLLKGMSTVAKAVGCTLGPRGKTVIIHKHGSMPVVTKDGVTVSKSINLKDPVEKLGCDLIKQAAERTNDVAGDGTTTSTVLTYAMVVEGNRLVSNGNNAQQICKGIDSAVKMIVKNLKEHVRPINTNEEIAQVATISANGDVEIGNLVAQAMERVGKGGIITVEDAKGTVTNLEVVEGLQFDRGYLSPYFVNNTERMHASYENTKVLITDKKLSDLRQLVPILEKVLNQRQPLLIIAEDIEGDALAGLVLNRAKANLPIVAVRAPGFGTFKEDLLNDLCALTSAKLVSSKTGLSLEKVDITDLGTVKKSVVDAKSTTIVADGKSTENVKKRISELNTQLEDVSLNVDEVSRLKSRIAGLSSGVAVIRVGGATELEMIERKHRIEDALHATHAATEEGIVPGGGMALLKAANDASDELKNVSSVDDFVLGARLVINACQAPLRRIVSNANGKPDVIINDALKTEKNVGYDAVNETFCNMYDAGIVDPMKVCRSAIQHAASVAVTFLMLDAVVFNEEVRSEAE